MAIIGPLAISTLAGLSTVLGALFIFLNVKKENINKFITFCLSLSLAIMIMISITELIPDSTYIISRNFPPFQAILLIILAFFFGYILISIINHHVDKLSTNNLYRLGILNMIALIAHNFPEGIATFISSYQSMTLGIKLAISIIFHNISEGISIAIPIYYATKNKYLSFKYTLISGLAEPLGAILAFLILKNHITDLTLSFILIFVAGIMITLAINKLLKEALNYHEQKYIAIGIFTGIIFTVINHFLF